MTSDVKRGYAAASRLVDRTAIEDRRQPLMRVRHAPALACGMVFHLIAFDLADAKIMAPRRAEHHDPLKREPGMRNHAMRADHAGTAPVPAFVLHQIGAHALG